jgi:hypothetical protein
MIIGFYKTKYSESTVPVVTKGVHYDKSSGVITFNGTYDIDEAFVQQNPQKLVIILDNERYPFLIEVTKIIYKEKGIVVLLSSFIQTITSDAMMSTWCIPI